MTAFRKLAFAALAALAAGCSVATPFPITPIQMMDGTWPPPDTPVATAGGVSNKPYTLKGDTFSYPAIGFSVTRASQTDWAFQPTDTGVAVMHRIQGEEPRASLVVQLVSIPPGTDVAAAVAGDKANLEKAGAKVTVAERTVGGIPGEGWTYELTDAQSGITAASERIYVLLEGGTSLVVIQTVASKGTYASFKPAFDAMIDSMRLPGSPSAAE